MIYLLWILGDFDTGGNVTANSFSSSLPPPKGKERSWTACGLISVPEVSIISPHVAGGSLPGCGWAGKGDGSRTGLSMNCGERVIVSGLKLL